MTLDEQVKDAFGDADGPHFFWQTQSAFVCDRERELVEAAFLPLGARLLDLGCAEGATLKHLGEPKGAIGVDISEKKLEFARRHVANAQFLAGSAYELPFEGGSFDQILIRDVIHHIDDPARVMAECARVLAPGGRLDVLEPCRNNPLILLHALAKPAERGELRSTRAFLTSLIGRTLRVIRVQNLQPMPIHRIVFHPALGRPALAKNPVARALVDGFERASRRVVPRVAWAYLHVRALKG